MATPVDVEAFGAAWSHRWPDVRPIGDELRLSAPETWVRFHGLPGGRRYAVGHLESDAVTARHLTLLEELSASEGSSADDLRVLTTAWSGSARSTEREPDLVSIRPDDDFWQPVLVDASVPGDETWAHLYVGTTELDSDDLRALLVLVADGAARGVIVCPSTVDWLYHPYDGGCDVIATDRATRDALRNRHQDWLSVHPLGL